MYQLNEQNIDEAIAELVKQFRAGAELNDELVADIADRYDMRPEALRQRFYRRYPDGHVPKALPTAEEAQRQKSRALAQSAMESHRLVTDKIDGREVLLDGELHTLITENLSKKTVIAFSHRRNEIVTISRKKWEGLQKAAPPT